MGEGWGEGENPSTNPTPPILSLSKDTLSLRGSSAHPELVDGRGNLVEVEHTSANHHCYGDEIANPRIEYGVAMTVGQGNRRGEAVPLQN